MKLQYNTKNFETSLFYKFIHNNCYEMLILICSEVFILYLMTKILCSES